MAWLSVSVAAANPGPGCKTTVNGGCNAASTPKIVLIMDDIGYRLSDREALKLPPQVAFSVLPGAPLTKELAYRAQQQGRDIMLHLPMAARLDKPLGPLALTAQMSVAQIAHTTATALDSLPMAIGLNNHMGSRLTEQPVAMQALMQTLKNRGIFFIDSRTTAASVAESVARAMGVPAARRDVFIDHEPRVEFMQQQFARLVSLAQQQKVAIGIVHPHPQTLHFLQHQLTLLPARNIELVAVSDIIPAPLIVPELPTLTATPVASMTKD
ncbi:divergent polysaccharide deacetylase family protein [Salinimonas marina]|uniref:Divergent polysaccharide deacetylase family protein n=1 Tax=Salinimonas marina TaxID=2785918 RepID=A0A7S9DWR6_9ALTE|nr:divergent polysaccharide deacetylase family protein [Salinimonas marina]QPG05394.1 divergent polysaccharide deacetylase family protein [Salinimonas marina]